MREGLSSSGIPPSVEEALKNIKERELPDQPTVFSLAGIRKIYEQRRPAVLEDKPYYISADSMNARLSLVRHELLWILVEESRLSYSGLIRSDRWFINLTDEMVGKSTTIRLAEEASGEVAAAVDKLRWGDASDRQSANHYLAGLIEDKVRSGTVTERLTVGLMRDLNLVPKVTSHLRPPLEPLGEK
jgi:hypothetical protein